MRSLWGTCEAAPDPSAGRDARPNRSDDGPSAGHLRSGPPKGMQPAPGSRRLDRLRLGAPASVLASPPVEKSFRENVYAYVGFDEAASAALRQAHPLVAPHFGAIIDDFYDTIEAHLWTSERPGS